jgi:hypothetical protein
VRLLRAELLQWYGLFGAALAWTAQHLIVFGVGYADCLAASRHWGLDVVTWTIVTTVVGGGLALVAEVASIRVLLATRAFEYHDAPPLGRQHFFAYAAALGNLLFIVGIVLNAIGALASTTCRPS